jgi:hypothetical protein
MEARDNSTSWFVRDVGIFLYGCIFAGRYIFIGKAALHRKTPGERIKDKRRQLWCSATVRAAQLPLIRPRECEH